MVIRVVDPSPSLRSTLADLEQLEDLGRRYDAPHFPDIDALLASGTPLDGVLIASTHATHFDVASKALDRGLHVLCEKPMTTDPREAWELATIARTSGRSFSVNNTANWRANCRRAGELVAAGRVGSVEHVSCYMGSPLLWLFDDPANDGWTKPTGSMVGNGFGWGQLSHSLAWVFRVTGLEPETVFATMTYSDKSGADLYDTGIVTCKGGATIAVEGVATLPGKNPVASKQITNRIFGSEGFLDYSGDDLDPTSGALVLRRHDGAAEEWPGFEFENYDDEGLGPESLLAFVDVCRGEAVYNGCDAMVGARTVATIDAMYRSAAENAVVEVAAAD